MKGINSISLDAQVRSIYSCNRSKQQLSHLFSIDVNGTFSTVPLLHYLKLMSRTSWPTIGLPIASFKGTIVQIWLGRNQCPTISVVAILNMDEIRNTERVTDEISDKG